MGKKKIETELADYPNFLYVEDELMIEERFKKKCIKELASELYEINKQIKILEVKRRTIKKNINKIKDLNSYSKEEIEIE